MPPSPTVMNMSSHRAVPKPSRRVPVTPILPNHPTQLTPPRRPNTLPLRSRSRHKDDIYRVPDVQALRPPTLYPELLTSIRFLRLMSVHSPQLGSTRSTPTATLTIALPAARAGRAHCRFCLGCHQVDRCRRISIPAPERRSL
jgi:hypothetical protein